MTTIEAELADRIDGTAGRSEGSQDSASENHEDSEL